MPMAFLTLCLSTLITVSPPVAGQPAALAAPSTDSATTDDVASSPLQLHTHMNGWGVWAGGSLYSTTLIAKTKGSRFGLVGLQYGRVLATENDMAVRFTADLIPFAVLSYPPPPRPEKADITPTPSPVYGIGAAPAGVQFVYHTSHPVQPFFGGSGGLMYFPSPIPDGRGRKLNYTFDFSAGLRWVVGDHRVLTVGYRFHHLSNGFRGEINPGFDANIFFIGLSTM